MNSDYLRHRILHAGIRTCAAALATLLMLAATAPPGSAAVVVGNLKTITLDGDLSDWDSSDIMYPDSIIGEGLPARTSYRDIYVAHDDDYLYVALHFKDTGGGAVTNNWYNRLYLDVDMDGNTGFDGGWMVGGYDQTVWYGDYTWSRYGFTGADQSSYTWSWSNLITYGYSETVAEYRVSRSGLGLIHAGDQVLLEFQTSGGDVTVETWAHQAEINVYTYQFGSVPEPATFALVGLGVLALRWSRRRQDLRVARASGPCPRVPTGR